MHKKIPIPPKPEWGFPQGGLAASGKAATHCHPKSAETVFFGFYSIFSSVFL